MINLLTASAQNYALRKMNDVPADRRTRLATDDYHRLASKVLGYGYATEYLLPDSENSMTWQKFTDNCQPEIL